MAGPATVMLVGSAPSYPYGIIDNIGAMSDLATRHNLWLHVDACNGGMAPPFAKQIGRVVQPFDFELGGVSSMSVGIHKLGYSNKGVSALLLKDGSNERHHRLTFENWPSGLYSTASIAGSRWLHLFGVLLLWVLPFFFLSFFSFILFY